MEKELQTGYQFETRAIHSGLGFTGDTGAVMPPVYLTSTFAQGNPDGFDYTRSGNPNFRNLDEVLANLEETKYATVFASGVSAITAIASTMQSGDVVLAEENIYGCTYRLFDKVFAKFGVSIEYVDFTKAESMEAIASNRPAIVWVESPTNPLLKVLDLRAIAARCSEAGCPLVVDNTFASSYVQKPVPLGATISLLSTTKYVNGHSDALGGAVCTDSKEWQDKMVFAQKALGLHPSPFDAWLIARGAKTLAVRMERHHANALAVAQFLESHSRVNEVRYPFLPSHPQYETAKSQMNGGSGIVTALFDLDIDEAKRFLNNLDLFTLAESLGGVESLVCHPATMTHAAIPKAQREAVGITDALVRFSVGIEHVDDLIADLERALGTV